MTSPRIGHEIYSLDGYLGYYQIMIPSKDKYKNISLLIGEDLFGSSCLLNKKNLH
jgi:hypothetical protein